jgi:hypothetical protein
LHGYCISSEQDWTLITELYRLTLDQISWKIGFGWSSAISFLKDICAAMGIISMHFFGISRLTIVSTIHKVGWFHGAITQANIAIQGEAPNQTAVLQNFSSACPTRFLWDEVNPYVPQSQLPDLKSVI